MRRLLAVTVTAIALLAIAGCTSGSTPDTAASGGGRPPGSPGATGPQNPEPASSGGTATTTDNGRQVCAAARKLNSEKVTTFITQLSKSLEAAAAGDTKGAETARAAATTAVREWSTGLRSEATKAQDTQLKTVLTEMATVASQMTTDLDKVDDARLDEMQGRLEQLCGV